MIVVRATVWPHGRQPSSVDHELIEPALIIANDGTGTADGPDQGGIGNYDVYVGNPDDLSRPRTWDIIGRIEDVPRDQQHRLFLVHQALELLIVHEAQL